MNNINSAIDYMELNLFAFNLNLRLMNLQNVLKLLLKILPEQSFGLGFCILDFKYQDFYYKYHI